MVILSDGSDEVQGAMVYARWLVGDNKFECRLIVAKGKLCPLDQKGDTVKSELNAAVMGNRLREFVEENVPYSFEKSCQFNEASFAVAKYCSRNHEHQISNAKAFFNHFPSNSISAQL